MRVYITHCCAKKNDMLEGTCEPVTPDNLYTATTTKRFMQACMARLVPWAIFSDKFGIWFPDVRHEWYEKDPSSVSEREFARLLADFDHKLERFDEIWFYYNPGRFHRLYKRLLGRTKLWDRVRKFTHLSEIGHGAPEINQGGGKDMNQRDPDAESGSVRVGRKEAARILSELHICKAYGPDGSINGPNCQRFGDRDPESGRWYWGVAKLIQEAQKRKCASPEEMRTVRDRYRVLENAEGRKEKESETPPDSPRSRADLEHIFRNSCVQLERAMRKGLPSPTSGPDHRTLGALIREAEKRQLLGSAILQEMRFVNSVRNALNHPSSEEILDGQIVQATESAVRVQLAIEQVKHQST